MMRLGDKVKVSVRCCFCGNRPSLRCCRWYLNTEMEGEVFALVEAVQIQGRVLIVRV